MSVAIDNIDDRAVWQALGRLFDHLLINPWMGGTANDLEADLRNGVGGHEGGFLEGKQSFIHPLNKIATPTWDHLFKKKQA